MKKINNNLLYPIILVEIYLAFIFVFYVFGPIQWRTENSVMFFIFIILVQTFLLIGYLYGIIKMLNRDKRSKELLKKNKLINDKTILHYLKIFLILNLLITILYLMRNTGLSAFSFDEILINLRQGLVNGSEQYYNKFDSNISFGGRLLAPIITISSFFLWPTIPLGLYFFKSLRLYEKLLLILNVFFEVARWISTGTNKGLIDMIIILITIYIIKNPTKLKNFFKFKNIIFSIIILILISFGISFFTANIDGRLRSNYDLLSRNINNTQIDFDNNLLHLFPDELHPTIIYSNTYLTQGYYATSLALKENFVPMFGIGSSFFILENIQEIFNLDLFQYTYQARLHYTGWDMKSNWHSIYLWLANDFSFVGVIIIMLLVGIYFGIVVYRTIEYKDPIFACIFSLLVLMFFYFPANNQVFQSPITFMGFWGLNFYWFYKTHINNKEVIYKLRWK